MKIATSIVGWIILFSSYTLVTLATPMLAVTVGEHSLLVIHSITPVV